MTFQCDVTFRCELETKAPLEAPWEQEPVHDVLSLRVKWFGLAAQPRQFVNENFSLRSLCSENLTIDMSPHFVCYMSTHDTPYGTSGAVDDSRHFDRWLKEQEIDKEVVLQWVDSMSFSQLQPVLPWFAKSAVLAIGGLIYFRWREETNNGRRKDAKLDETKLTAWKYFEYVADVGEADPDVRNIAFFACAQCCYNGFGVERDFGRAVQYLEKAINNGFLMADPANLILHYNWSGAVGSNMEVPLEKAFKYLEENSDTSDILLMLYGFCLFKGMGCKVDYLGARKAFEKLVQSEKNEPVTKKCKEMAYWCLGICFYFGKGKVRWNEKKAMECFKKSGDCIGNYCSAVSEFEEKWHAQFSGKDVTKSELQPLPNQFCNEHLPTFEKLKERMQEAANMIFLLRSILKEQSLEEIAKAVKADSSYNLCLSYNYGARLFAEEKFESAVEQFKWVATQGGQEKQFDIKEFLKKRQGSVLPARWTRIKAEAKAQMPNSQFLMGAHHYLAGKKDKALDWFKAASDACHGDASFAYAYIEHNIQNLKLSEIRSYYEKAASKDTCLFEAQYLYGESLRREGEVSKAAQYFQWAAQEVLRRRQCRELTIGSLLLYYNMIPEAMTGHVTDNYFEQQFAENFQKLLTEREAEVRATIQLFQNLKNIRCR